MPYFDMFNHQLNRIFKILLVIGIMIINWGIAWQPGGLRFSQFHQCLPMVSTYLLAVNTLLPILETSYNQMPYWP